MNHKTCEYGVLTQNGLLSDCLKSQKPRTALFGTIVKCERGPNTNNNILTVSFLKDDSEVWESNQFVCDRSTVAIVSESMWPFLAALSSPMDRLKLAKDPMRCQQLLQIAVDDVVGFQDFGEVRLGTVTHIGPVKGMGIGKVFGIKLHEKKINNTCDGSCAGLRYFHCPPGFGVFTTIERLIPRIPQSTAPINKVISELDHCITTNILHINNKIKSNEAPVYRKEISIQTGNVGAYKSSQSLHDILGTSKDHSTINTNNDFDNNSILQSDHTYLIGRGGQGKHKEQKPKSEVDLIDIIGTSWGGSSSTKELEEYYKLNNSSTRLDNEKNAMGRMAKGRSLNPSTHVVSGSKTVPRKSKLLHEKPVTKNGDGDSKLNRKIESQQEQCPRFKAPPPGSTNDLTVGSLVEISNDIAEEPLYGVVRWLGVDTHSQHILVGVELEEEHAHLPLTLTDGVHHGQRLFNCMENRALFVPLEQCHKDSRFNDGTGISLPSFQERKFGKEMDCPVIQGCLPPLCMSSEKDVEAICGKSRGIQGHHNSCYLDATLFAMFTFTAVFDSLLFRPKGPNDIDHYEEVQRVLKEEIVNPLRNNLFVRADRVMSLRKLLDQLSSVSGLTSEEKDPEEFLNSLLAQILKAEPFLKLSSGQEAYHYQLFVEKDDGLSLPTVQQLFEQSFLTSDIKLKEVPSCLIIQMPRFGKSYKMYPRILPSQLLDVTDIIENSPRQCTVCGKLAKWECKQCFGECGTGLESTAFCTQCIEKAHAHARRSAHKAKPLTVPHDYTIMQEHCDPPRLYMELFAVVCIETSHYVAFVKCGVGHEAPWCFFDSMADRKGEVNGYNIPEMVACPDISKWLADEELCRNIHDNSPSDRYLPEHARRLLCDAYICMYQSPDVMMYR